MVPNSTRMSEPHYFRVEKLSYSLGASFSYMKRCGPRHAASMLRDMLPMSTAEAQIIGLIDIEVATSTSLRHEVQSACIDHIHAILEASSTDIMDGSFICAPWSTYNSVQKGASPPRRPVSLVQFMSENKALAYRYRDFPPLLHYRIEELSQMLLDCFHPTRSKRYHERRYRFIRKVKAEKTPFRYAAHVVPAVPDPEDTTGFDDAPGWTRGEEWGWVGMETPTSLSDSEKTKIDLWYQPSNPRKGSATSSTSSAPKITETRLSTSASVSSDSTGPITPSSSKRSLNLFAGRNKKEKHDPPITPIKPARTLTASPKREWRPTSPSPGRFKTLTRRVSSVILSLGSRSSSPTPPTHVLGEGLDSAEKMQRIFTPVPMSMELEYQIPQIANASDCDFPCLYNPDGTDEDGNEIEERMKKGQRIEQDQDQDLNSSKGCAEPRMTPKSPVVPF